jgi:hypothetical protein
MANGNVVSRRIDHVDSIAWDKKTGMCQIWYNYEPEHFRKNYTSSLHYLSEKAFLALMDAWKNGKNVELDETKGKYELNNDMQHEMYRAHQEVTP